MRVKHRQRLLIECLSNARTLLAALVYGKCDSMVHFSQGIFELLDREQVEYAIKAGFHDWLGWKQQVMDRKPWIPVEPGVESFTAKEKIAAGG